MKSNEFTDYTLMHRRELEELLASEEWQKVIKTGLVDEVRDGRIEPKKVRNYVDTVVEQLVEFNEGKVKEVIRQGKTDEAYLLEVLSQWPDNLNGKNTRLSFFGINLSTKCNFYPNKCVYCNQAEVSAIEDMNVWKRLLKEVGDGGIKLMTSPRWIASSPLPIFLIPLMTSLMIF